MTRTRYTPAEELEQAKRVAQAAWDKLEVAQRLQREATHRAISAEDRIDLARIALRRDPPNVADALAYLEAPR